MPDQRWAEPHDDRAHVRSKQMDAPFDTLVVSVMLMVATVTDLRRREVPGWLTFGGIAAGVLVAAMNGANAQFVSLLGLMAGGLTVLPFVLIGAFGVADALLLAAVGAWKARYSCCGRPGGCRSQAPLSGSLPGAEVKRLSHTCPSLRLAQLSKS